MATGLSAANSAYWSDLCGSRAAAKLGIQAGSEEGIELFDRWFFKFYPYLDDETFIPWSALSALRVLEIGLGYGSVTRRLNRCCNEVISLDIAPRAVDFARSTAPGISAIRASALQIPLPNNSVDHIISIGCLHMTGDLRAGIRECMRVLRPGGRFTMMVYNTFSYKHWILAPVSTWKSRRSEKRGADFPSGQQAPKRVSWFWDRNPSGSAPPHTEFASSTQLLKLLNDARTVEVTVVNVDNVNDLLPLRFQRLKFDGLRIRLLKSWLSLKHGLDVYVNAVK